MTTTWIAIVVTQGVTTVLLVVVVLGMLRRINPMLEHGLRHQVRDPLQSDEAPPLGAALPAFTLRSVDGALVSRDRLLAHARVLLLADAKCPPCLQLLADIESEQADPAWSQLAVIATDSVTAQHRRLADLPSVQVVLTLLRKDHDQLVTQQA
jgi:hypothetical protein